MSIAQVKLAPAPPPTNPVVQKRGLGKVRMSPLMYGSLSYIATAHKDGTISIDELSQLKQTQIRSFMKQEWIKETKDRNRVGITELGKHDLRAFTTNDEFFRKAARMSFSCLLNLRLPDVAPGVVAIHTERGTKKPTPRKPPVSEIAVGQKARRAG